MRFLSAIPAFRDDIMGSTSRNPLVSGLQKTFKRIDLPGG
jgi:hypothetical protein